MSLKFDWFLPTNGGDGRDVVGGGHGVDAGPAGRPVTIDYLGQIARSAEQLGFESALVPTGAWCEDAWVTTAMLSEVTRRLGFLVALRPGLMSPLLAAQMATSFQNLSGGRLLLNVVTGGESAEQRAFGDFLDKDARYARCDEFLTIVRRLWDGEQVDFAGEHLRVEGARLHRLPEVRPEIQFGGSSPAAGQVAARHADVYLTWGEPPAAVAEKVRWIRELADREGRELRFGLRVHVINRDTSEEAWAEADRLLAAIDDETIARVQAGLARSESVGQQRMLRLNGGSRAELEIHPGLWAGVGLVRGGAGTSFVGSHEQVADLIEEYQAVGIDQFVLSAYPHLEGAYWFGEGVLPVLEKRGLWKRAA
ncbi:LLM class flavin-dependent oxidoreductase [Nocardioides nitrophenolicus]|uniref:LLM class flavin-dependent oxidoreductase n=1 Tax=Nocardioides nitrophenolicus TaxID=60489 RepID=UPI00195CF2DD|nr:LLM class flavin-dependent oxidoreductase [Nocardioides nitrophenolicus]MBM7516842.1 alkanesulfonate monooxygenase [Nocardioides nitrophenolicus]